MNYPITPSLTAFTKVKQRYLSRYEKEVCDCLSKFIRYIIRVIFLAELHIPKRKVHFENMRTVTRFLTKVNFKSLRTKIDFNSWTQHQVSNFFLISDANKRFSTDGFVLDMLNDI